MAKAPRPGCVKTRLSPPLTADQAAALSVCFLKDTAESLTMCMPALTVETTNSNGHAQPSATGVVSYTPLGDEALFEGLLPTGFSLIPQRGEAFGERLFLTARDVFACGYGSVCLIDSDSPTVPAASFRLATNILQTAGDRKNRVVLGPSHDGGYYLIGLAHPHPEPFDDIHWSTDRVATETRERCHSAGLSLMELPLWYDVDDAESLALLHAELLDNLPPPFATTTGYAAPHTRTFLQQFQRQGSARP
jgi:rSAM/selenodomain-associated transferase 1